MRQDYTLHNGTPETIACNSRLCDRLRSSTIIWKQLSLRSIAICDLRSAIRDRLRSPAIIWKPALRVKITLISAFCVSSSELEIHFLSHRDLFTESSGNEFVKNNEIGNRDLQMASQCSVLHFSLPRAPKEKPVKIVFRTEYMTHQPSSNGISDEKNVCNFFQHSS